MYQYIYIYIYIIYFVNFVRTVCYNQVLRLAICCPHSVSLARLCSQDTMSWKTVFIKQPLQLVLPKYVHLSQNQPNLDLGPCTFCHVIYKIGEANIVSFRSGLNAEYINRCLPNVLVQFFMAKISFWELKYFPLKKSGNPKNIVPALEGSYVVSSGLLLWCENTHWLSLVLYKEITWCFNIHIVVLCSPTVFILLHAEVTQRTTGNKEDKCSAKKNFYDSAINLSCLTRCTLL